MTDNLKLVDRLITESPLQARLRKDLRCSETSPCRRHSCFKCASAFGTKYWNHVAKLKANSSNKKLSAIHFQLKQPNLHIGDVNPELVRKLRDEAVQILQGLNLATSRWIGLVHVFPLVEKSPSSCLIVGAVHIAALTRSEFLSLKAGIRKSKLVELAWIDDVDDCEIKERRGIPGGWGCYSQKNWIDQLKPIQQSDQIIAIVGHRV